MCAAAMPIPVKNSPRSHPRFATLLGSLALKMTNNTDFPDCTVTGQMLQTTADLFVDACAKARNGGTLAVAHRNKVRKDAEGLVDQLVLYVRLDVRARAGDVATATHMILGTGLSIQKDTPVVKAPLTATYGLASGQVVLSAKAVAKTAMFYFEYSLDGVNWVAAADEFQTRTLLTGLEAAKVYSFRFRAKTRKGMTDYSQVVTLLVH
jgi:hypothetical protein